MKPARSAMPFDPLLLLSALALTAVGAVMVYSASAVVAEKQLHSQFHFLTRQLIAVVIGLVALVVAMRLGPARIAKLAYPLLVISLVGLVVVLIPGIGRKAGGARRWIDLGFMSFQPAEAAKVALVLFLARSLSRKNPEQLRTFKIGVLPHLIVTGAVMVLCLAEKDLGSCVVLGVVFGILLFSAGARLPHLGALVLLAVPVVWYAIAGTDYRVRRIEAWRDPFVHRDGAGFQMVESLLGVGNGGWFGQGLGQGKGKLFYLPAAHTDFIGAVVAEETGLVGMALLILLYAVFVWRGVRAAFRSSDPFSCWAALGLSSLVGVQALLNLSVVLVILPTKGLTLPFVSYGGSSLITLLGATGVLLAVSASRGGYLREAEQAVRVEAGPEVAR